MKKHPIIKSFFQVDVLILVLDVAEEVRAVQLLTTAHSVLVRPEPEEILDSNAKLWNVLRTRIVILENLA